MGDSAAMRAFRVVFVSQEDPFYVRLFFEEFLKSYPKRWEVAAVVFAPPMGKRSVIDLAKQMYQFYGLVDFLRVGTRYVSYKVRSRLPVMGGRFFSVRQVCRYHGVPVLDVDSVNGESFLDVLRASKPDLVISVAAPQVFRAALIGIPRLGCINIHNAKLPKYRGMLPNFWQMYCGEKAVGTTIHRINDKLDDGEILFQTETDIEPGESLDELICRTKRFGAHLMVRAIDALERGVAVPVPNVTAEATYFSFPTSADVAEFRKKGYRLI